jgi:polyferredoxin
MPAQPARPSTLGSGAADPLAFHRAAPPASKTARGRGEADNASRPARHAVRRRRFARRQRDRTQLARRSVQIAFLLLNVWIGARFYLFVRYFETAGRSVFVARPPGVEGWLPIAALMNLKYFLLTGRIPDVHPAGLFLLVAFAAISFVFRKAFCSWLCPIGTVSEWLWQGGREIFARNLALPCWLDIPLRGLKYLLLGLFLYAIGRMTAADIRAFMDAPYGLIADVKMLDFFRALSSTAALVLAVLVVCSILMKNAWCRYLCPYGALMGLLALASPARIRRNPDACIDCGKCAKACPSLLPVDSRITIKSAECTNCLECVSICPARGALDLVGPRRRAIPGWAVAAGVAILFFGLFGYARLSGHWETKLPAHTYFELIPNASEYGHPGY